jgi:hypothetical protein
VPDYFTSIFNDVEGDEVVETAEWKAQFRPDDKKRFSIQRSRQDGTADIRHPKQLYITASDLISANNALTLMLHCTCLLEANFCRFIDHVMPEQNSDLPSDINDPIYIFFDGPNIWKTNRIAKEVESRGHNFQFALFRYAQSLFLSPDLNRIWAFRRFSDVPVAPPNHPIQRIQLASSLHQAVSGIEQVLGSLKSIGKIRKSLADLNIASDSVIHWETLQDESMFQDKSWSAPQGFDQLKAFTTKGTSMGGVPIDQAIAKLYEIRNDVAHAIDAKNDRQLYYFFALNAQNVLRRLLLEALGCWRGFSSGLWFADEGLRSLG